MEGVLMQVAELYDLSVWVHDEVIQTNIVAHYLALRKAVHQAAQEGQAQQSFEPQRESLFALLREVPMYDLSSAQLEMLKNFSIADNVGDSAVKTIENILFRNQLDAATAAAKLAAIVDEMNQGQSKSEQIRGALEGLIREPEREFGEIPIRIVFTKNASIDNLKDLKAWSNQWFQIVEGITRAHGVAPEKIRVVGAGTGSIIFELATEVIALGGTLGTIVIFGLKATTEVMKIRKGAEVIRGLKIDNSAKLAKELEKSADKLKKDKAEEITKEISIKLEINQTGEGDKIVHLGSAVEKVLDFLDKGGEVDAWVPEDEIDEEDDQEEQKLLRNDLQEMFEEVRRLKTDLRLLEHKSNEDEEEE
jgi:hypothetical protein